MEFNVSQDLIDAINRETVTVAGQTYQLRVVGVVGDPRPPQEPLSAFITVATEQGKQEKRGACRFSLNNLEDHTYVVENLKGTMIAVLTGDLGPGEIRYL